MSFETNDWRIVEQYKYDPAGNILKKIVNGKETIFSYDKANQLVKSESLNPKSETNSKSQIINYQYDGAGRLISENSTDSTLLTTSTKTYTYGWLDKVTKVTDKNFTDAESTTEFSYFPDGQLASRSALKPDNFDNEGTADERGLTRVENFYWDGLALIKRDEVDYTVEPAVTGGNAILADNKVLFNDMLGSSIGTFSESKFCEMSRSAFGEFSADSAALREDFFTGKPNIEGLGYAFLFRNYRADFGKWQTSDPLGYPDGWNNLAYCGNRSNRSCDPLGLYDLMRWIYTGNGNASDDAYNEAISSAGESVWNSYQYMLSDYPPMGTALNYYVINQDLVNWTDDSVIVSLLESDPLVNAYIDNFMDSVYSRLTYTRTSGTMSGLSDLMVLDTSKTYDLGSALILGQFYINAYATYDVTLIGDTYYWNASYRYTINDRFDFQTWVHTLSFGLLSLGKEFNINIEWNRNDSGSFPE